MRDGFRIIDADRHVIEPFDMWSAYLPPELRDRAPHLEQLEPDGPPDERIARLGARGMVSLAPVPMLGGRPLWRGVSERAQVELAWASLRRPGQLAAAADPRAQLRAMDEAGIDVSFLYPTFAMYLVGFDDLEPELGNAFAGAYNRWLRDLVRADPARLRGVGLVSPHDPASMVGELERIADFGFLAVVLRPNPVKGRLLSDPAYEPFWAACERMSLAVAIHEGTHAWLPTAGADRFTSRFALHACSHPMEQMMALLALVEGGVLERHPKLRVGLLEAGCGWVPYWLWRLDEEYRNLAGEVAERVRRAPSSYFSRQCFVAFEPGEPILPELLSRIGADRVLFGTDFPHLDHEMDIVNRALALRGRLSDEMLQSLLADNAARFYGLVSSNERPPMGRSGE